MQYQTISPPISETQYSTLTTPPISEIELRRRWLIYSETAFLIVIGMDSYYVSLICQWKITIVFFVNEFF